MARLPKCLLIRCEVCDATVLLDVREDVDCPDCGASYNRYGKRVDIPEGYPPSHYHEDRRYAESGDDNLMDMSEEELKESGWIA
jgi:hypothetical protein